MDRWRYVERIRFSVSLPLSRRHGGREHAALASLGLGLQQHQDHRGRGPALDVPHPEGHLTHRLNRELWTASKPARTAITVPTCGSLFVSDIYSEHKITMLTRHSQLSFGEAGQRNDVAITDRTCRTYRSVEITHREKVLIHLRLDYSFEELTALQWSRLTVMTP